MKRSERVVLAVRLFMDWLGLKAKPVHPETPESPDSPAVSGRLEGKSGRLEGMTGRLEGMDGV